MPNQRPTEERAEEQTRDEKEQQSRLIAVAKGIAGQISILAVSVSLSVAVTFTITITITLAVVFTVNQTTKIFANSSGWAVVDGELVTKTEREVVVDGTLKVRKDIRLTGSVIDMKESQCEQQTDPTFARICYDQNTRLLTVSQGGTFVDLKGDKGDPGTNGIDGLAGSDGEPGDKGDTGAQGAKGEQGETGEPGKLGARAISDGGPMTFKHVRPMRWS